MGSIILLKDLFNETNLFEIISFAKKERIDKQYYVDSEENIEQIKESTKDMVKKAEDFLLKIKTLIKNLNSEKIKNIRYNFNSLFEQKEKE